MKCQSNIPKYEEFKFLNECQIQFDLILESLKSARKLYLETGKLSKSQFDKLNEVDISPTKKYLERICKWVATDEDEIVDRIELKRDIAIYDMLCNKKLIKKTDINSFKTYDDFQEFVEANKNLTSKAEEKDKIKTKEADAILDDDRWFIISPLTHGASCIFGAGTKWCTTMKDPQYWESYTSKFIKMYYCVDKSKNKSSNMYKFAVAVYPSGDKECYDAEDKPFRFRDVLKLGLKEDIFKVEVPTLEKQIASWFEKLLTIDDEGFYSTNGNVKIKKWNEDKLPIRFKYVGGDFNCSDNHLRSLEGCPEEVGGGFNCANNHLTSLDGCPQKVKLGFVCSGNKIPKSTKKPKGVKGPFII